MKRSADVRRVDPEEVRDGVVDLMWEHRHWPGSSREEYERLWRWRYEALGDGEPAVWAARAPDGEIIGHYAVFPRHYRLGEHEIRVGVPGDLLVHRQWRGSGVGIFLCRLPMRLAREGAWDVVLVTATPEAHELAVRLGYRDLGALHRFVDVRSSGGLLGQRIGPLGGAVAPVLDAGLALRRRVRRSGRMKRTRGLDVRALDGDALFRLERSHWEAHADRLVSAGSVEYLAGRFLEHPHADRTTFGVIDREAGRLEACVTVAFNDGIATVEDCQTNAARVTEIAAIALVGEHLPNVVRSYEVPTLRRGRLADELRNWGFIHRQPEEESRATPRVAVYWNRDHPLAHQFRQTGAWSLYSGIADA